MRTWAWNAALGLWEFDVTKVTLVEDSADVSVTAGVEREVLAGSAYTKVYDRLFIALWGDVSVGKVVAEEIVAGKSLGDRELIDLAANPSSQIKFAIYELNFPLSMESRIVLRNPDTTTHSYRAAIYGVGGPVRVA